MKSIEINSPRISAVPRVVEERTLKGNILGSPVPARDIPHHIALYRGGRLPVDRPVTHRIKLEEINLGFDHRANGDVARHRFPVS
jgi:alcohol dehydrogenase